MNDRRPSDNSLLLEAQGIVKRFPSGDTFLEVLKGVNISVNPAQLAILSGPSGSGKSTLLYILGGLEKPDSGEIRFRGESINSYNQEKIENFRNQKIGFVFQLHYLLPDFTALENVMIPAMIKGLSRQEAADKAKKSLSDLALYERKGHYPNQLSGGEQQRVAVARALINSPELILADEPTGNLDRQNASQLLKLFRKLVDDTGVSILVATHDPELADIGGGKFRLFDGRIEPWKSLAKQ